MKMRRLAAMFGCLVLAACSSSPGSLPTSTGASSAARANPNASSVVDIHFVNKSPQWVLFETEYSYPISPVWYKAHRDCVGPGKNWNTYIDYNHPHPEALVRATTKTSNDCQTNGKDHAIVEIGYKQLIFENGHSLIQGTVVDDEKLGYLFCYRKTGNGNVGCVGMDF